MGARLWHHLAPWRPDPAEALRELQARFLAENYELPTLVREQRESAREAVRSCEADGDEYGLLEIYRGKLAMLEAVASGPLPDDPGRQIELIRASYRDSGEGVGNVLDVTGVSDRGAMEARILGPDEILQYCPTDRPTIRQAAASALKINEVLGRGESVCFPVHGDETNDGPPVGWYFVGNTID